MSYHDFENRKNIYKNWKKWVNLDERSDDYIQKRIIPALSKLSRKDQARLFVRPALKHLDHHRYMLTTGKNFDQAYEFWSSKNWRCAQRQVDTIGKLRAIYESSHPQNGRHTGIYRAMLLWYNDPERSSESFDIQDHERNPSFTPAILNPSRKNLDEDMRREKETGIFWLIALTAIIGALFQKFFIQ